MNSENAIQDLERALLERARKLADEYMQRARATREHIISDENERLRLREERETLAAEAAGERLYRRSVQASELKMRAELDNLRWQLVENARAAVMQQLAKLHETPEHYRQTLRRYLREAVEALPEGDLLIELNERDAGWLAPLWSELLAEIGGQERAITLSERRHHGSGGLIAQSGDGAIRLDNTFEGRAERLNESLNQAIIERLFARAGNMEMIWHG